METAPMNHAEQAIHSLLDRFEQAWSRKDVDALLEMVAHDDGLFQFGTDESEVFEGYAASESALRAMVASLGEVSYRIRDRRIGVHRDGELAWLACLIDLDSSIGGQPVHVKGLRMTAVVQHRESGWVIVQSHSSVPVAGQVVAYEA